MTKNYEFVNVTEPSGIDYSVGPFEINDGFAESSKSEAVNWIYKQIGIIKTIYPDSQLIKHRWDYGVDQSAFVLERKVDIKVEILGYFFEVVSLKLPNSTNVIQEEFEAT